MKARILPALAVFAVLVVPTLATGDEPRAKPIKVEGKYATVNGLKMYYEVHGTGRPLVLLHGAFGWATVYPTLA